MGAEIAVIIGFTLLFLGLCLMVAAALITNSAAFLLLGLVSLGAGALLIWWGFEN